MKWKWNLRWRRSHWWTFGVLCVGEVVEHDFDVEVLRHVGIDLVQKGEEVSRGVGLFDVGDHGARRDVQRREQVAGAVALIVMCCPRRRARQHRESRCRSVERLDLGLFVDGKDHRSDRGVQIEPDDVTDLLYQVSGSGETLKASSRQGFRPKARQISDTVWRLIPCFFARPLVDQCVASDGVDSKVSTTTASTMSSPMLRAAPGRGASTSPSRRYLSKAVPPFPDCDRDARRALPRPRDQSSHRHSRG